MRRILYLNFFVKRLNSMSTWNRENIEFVAFFNKQFPRERALIFRVFPMFSKLLPDILNIKEGMINIFSWCGFFSNFRAHPHNLVGREGCKKGVCTLEIPPDTMTVSFSNLGIQCVKKKDIELSLKIREEIRVDPFRSEW